MSEKRAKILVVDDDPDLVEAVQLTLESAGYAVSSASDAKEGWAKAVDEKPDLILLDIMMPTGTEGFHFTWKLRQEAPDEVKNVPIIVLSAIHGTTKLRFYPEESDSTYGPGEYLPVQDFVDKPVDPATLLERVERALKTAKQTGETGKD